MTEYKCHICGCVFQDGTLCPNCLNSGFDYVTHGEYKDMHDDEDEDFVDECADSICICPIEENDADE